MAMAESLEPELLAQLAELLLVFGLGHPSDILQLPLHGWQSFHSFDPQESPVGPACLDGKQEALFGVHEFRLELRDQPLPGVDERLVFHMLHDTLVVHLSRIDG